MAVNEEDALVIHPEHLGNSSLGTLAALDDVCDVSEENVKPLTNRYLCGWSRLYAICCA